MGCFRSNWWAGEQRPDVASFVGIGARRGGAQALPFSLYEALGGAERKVGA